MLTLRLRATHVMKPLQTLCRVPRPTRPGEVAGLGTRSKACGIRQLIKIRAETGPETGWEQSALDRPNSSQARKTEARRTQVSEQGRWSEVLPTSDD